jgi:hypothetical protein
MRPTTTKSLISHEGRLVRTPEFEPNSRAKSNKIVVGPTELATLVQQQSSRKRREHDKVQGKQTNSAKVARP